MDFNGNPYHYIEIKEIPSFAFCAKTREKALENYKKQLRLSLMLMLEDGDHIVEPGEETEDDIKDLESISLTDDSDLEDMSLNPLFFLSLLIELVLMILFFFVLAVLIFEDSI